MQYSLNEGQKIQNMFQLINIVNDRWLNLFS